MGLSQAEERIRKLRTAFTRFQASFTTLYLATVGVSHLGASLQAGTDHTGGGEASRSQAEASMEGCEA